MKKFKHLMNAGLLGSVIALGSCSEEKIIDLNTGGEGSSSQAEAVDCTVNATIKSLKTFETRANWQNEAYAWNAQDAFTVWEQKEGAGYNFTISTGYDGSAPAATAEFAGKMPLVDGHKLVAVYPFKEASTFDEIATFAIPAECTQAAGNAELGAYSFMVATTNVTDGAIPDLEFAPLTATLQFDLKNVAKEDLKVRRITVESNGEVFPGAMKINGNGEVESVSDMRKSLSLNMSDQTVAPNASLNGYLNIIPTQYNADANKINGETGISLKATVVNSKDEEQVITILSNVALKDMNEKTGMDMEASAYQFAAGKRYKITCELDNFRIPEEGYVADEEGNATIYNLDGLIKWSADEAAKSKTVTLMAVPGDEDSWTKEVDFEGKEWKAIDFFAGTFNGNGFTFKNMKGCFAKTNGGTIKNLTFENATISTAESSSAGLILTNNGTLENITISNINMNVSANTAGALAASNSGTVAGCTLESGTINITVSADGMAGGLIGSSTGNITDCKVGKSDVSLSVDCSNYKVNVGGLLGQTPNAAGKQQITNSSVSSSVTVSTTGTTPNPNIGGLVGWLASGSISASSASATFDVAMGSIGGLVGQIQSPNPGSITLCYASGSLNIKEGGFSSSNVGGLIGKTFNTKVQISSCYTTVTLPETANKLGGIQGDCGGASAPAYTACFYTQEGVAAINNPVNTDIPTLKDLAPISTADLKGKANEMNAAASTAGCTAYQFAENSSDTEPLIIKAAE